MKRVFVYIVLALCVATAHAQRWTEQKAKAWYAKQPWLVGANYTPASAINQLEMWQADTFNPQQIDKELGWAQDIGMNTMRVFLHDQLWEQDSAGFTKRIEEFLRIADKHKIKPMFVLFDSVWDPHPKLGKQREPKPGVHNSGWVQGPGAEALQDPKQQARLEAYVKGVVGHFAKDKRVLAWDIWNEPDNTNGGSYGKEEPKNKVELVLALLPKAFEWARSVNPTQPLTSGIWIKEDFDGAEKMSPMAKTQIQLSDIISFHGYEKPEAFEHRIKALLPYNRPIICTEYMARGAGSTFQNSLPIAKKYNVGMINWGLVAGKTQTNLPWDSWEKPYVDREPEVWFHEVFKGDGTPYKQEEVDFIKQITGRGANKKAKAASPSSYVRPLLVPQISPA